MEDMEVDLLLGGTETVTGDGGAQLPILIPDSDSSTDVEENEEAEVEPSDPPHPPRLLMSAWAFSQGMEPGPRTAPAPSAPRAIRRRAARPGPRLRFSTQPSLAPSRPLDFLLRVPSAVAAAPAFGNAPPVSESEDEDEAPAPASPLLLAPLSDLGPSAPGGPAPPPDPAAADHVVAVVTERSAPIAAKQPELALRAPPAGADKEDEGEGETCSICFESWTTTGEHRLATLRCGHLFGFKCIERWLRGDGAKCPQCNKKAKKSDIVPLYARKLRALDNSEQESMRRSLQLEHELRRKAELESAQCRLQLQVLTDECGKLRKQVQELKTLMAQPGCGLSQPSGGGPALGLSQRQDGAPGRHYAFAKAVLVSQTGGCRVMSYCEPLSCLLVSQPSPQATLRHAPAPTRCHAPTRPTRSDTPDTPRHAQTRPDTPRHAPTRSDTLRHAPTLSLRCGVKKISAVDLKAFQYPHLLPHNTLKLSRYPTPESLKLSSLLTNTVVQTYNAGRPVWSCCWCLDNRNYIYAGLNNGSVLLYDTRDTSTHVQELTPQGSRCPVASLSYVPRAASSTFPCGGLIAGSLDGGCFWEQVDELTYRPHVLPLETGGCTDIQVEPESRHCLVTYRPGRSNPLLRCVLMELSRAPQDSARPPACSCLPVQTFSAGPSCKLLTKSAVFPSPARDHSTLVCAGDEASHSTMVWDAGTGALIQKLPADLPVLDICPFEVNQDSYLASLTEKMLKIYKWDAVERSEVGQAAGASQPRRATGWKLAEEEACREDLTRLCPKHTWNNNLAVLECLQDKKEDSEIAADCNHLLWNYKLNLTTDPKFESVAVEVCKTTIVEIKECAEEERGKGYLLSCLVDHRGNITEYQCHQYITKMTTIIFSDYRLICGFMDKCREDINTLHCGSISAGEKDIHSQGEVISCLEKGLVKEAEEQDGRRVIKEDCKKAIMRVAELSGSNPLEQCFHLDRYLYFSCREATGTVLALPVLYCTPRTA
ncbi:hypothetical protein COCON_G00218850 [Conger conger]|uniref:RING-type E3 ubiquitin transferase n=1 Tax=Conger conger TaxID=82655 RepID=A0A9Q1HPN2_CONCO|nr:hypothetical protein COCON_G00218850 [Conger conger]